MKPKIKCKDCANSITISDIGILSLKVNCTVKNKCMYKSTLRYCKSYIEKHELSNYLKKQLLIDFHIDWDTLTENEKAYTRENYVSRLKFDGVVLLSDN